MMVAIVASIATSLPPSILERDVDVSPGVLTVDAPSMTRRFRLTTSVPFPSLKATVTLVFVTVGPNRTTPDVPIRVVLSAVDAKDIEPVVFDTTASNAQAASSPRESFFLCEDTPCEATFELTVERLDRATQPLPSSWLMISGTFHGLASGHSEDKLRADEFSVEPLP